MSLFIASYPINCRYVVCHKKESAYTDDLPLSRFFRFVIVGSVFLRVADFNEFEEHFVIGPMVFLELSVHEACFPFHMLFPFLSIHFLSYHSLIAWSLFVWKISSFSCFDYTILDLCHSRTRRNRLSAGRRGRWRQGWRSGDAPSPL